MAKYVYPAVFTPEVNGYSINFPDFECCYTSAETLEDGMVMANDVLCLTLYGMEEAEEPIPQASGVKDVEADGNSFVTLVACDTIDYRKLYDNKAVKKTLSIPAWLNTLAEREGVNFSMLLQSALKTHLHIQ